MKIFCVIFVFILTLFLFFVRFKRRKHNFANSNILILGGTSGLGEALSHILHKYKANVTIASRTKSTENKHFRHFEADVTKQSSLNESDTKYDYIFCCAGGVEPCYFKESSMDIYRRQIELNYLGTLNVLNHYFNVNSRPFSFVMIASTVALFTFPGYSAYAPTKAALKSFYHSCYLELKKNNVDLYIYYVNSMQTPGFLAENKIKSEFTREIEGMKGMSPEKAAFILLKEMEYSNEICSDSLTKIFKMKCEIDSLRDYLYMLVSLVAYPFIKWYVNNKFTNK